MNIEVVNTGDQDTKLLGAAPVDAVAATNTLTSNNTNVNADDTVTVGTKVYAFKNALSTNPAVEGEVLKAGSADASLTNLMNAINHTGTPGTDYTCAAQHPLVSSGTVIAHALTFTARTKGAAGNLIALARSVSATTLTVGNALFQNGIDGTPGTPTQIEIYNGQPYICIAPATITTTGAWKKLTIASL